MKFLNMQQIRMAHIYFLFHAFKYCKVVLELDCIVCGKNQSNIYFGVFGLFILKNS